MTADLVGLADCPFCPGRPELKCAQADEDSMHWWVECTKCGARNGEAEAESTPDQEFAITAWNTRAELRALGGGGRTDFIKGYVYAADRLAQPSLSIDAIQARAELAAEREGYDSPAATVEG